MRYVDNNNDSMKALNKKADEYYFNNNYQDALECYLTIIEDKTYIVEDINLILGTIYNHFNDEDNTLKYFLLYVDEDTNFDGLSSLYCTIAEIYLGKSEFSQALEYINKGLNETVILSIRENIYYIKGLICLGLEDFFEARICFNNSHNIFLNDKSNIDNIARMYSHYNQKDMAVELLSKYNKNEL